MECLLITCNMLNKIKCLRSNRFVAHLNLIYIRKYRYTYTENGSSMRNGSRRKPTPTNSHILSSLNTKNISENNSIQEEINFELLNKNDQDQENLKKKFKKNKVIEQRHVEDEVDQIVG
jgi:hypothetical protein